MTHTIPLPLPLLACGLALLLTAAPLCADDDCCDVPAAAPIDAQVDQWLTRLEDRSRQITTLTANLRYDRIEPLLGDEQRRFGKLSYQAGPPARFAVHFDRLIVDGNRGRPQNRWYIFDGRWLVERLDDEKQFRKFEVIAPDAKPEDADPLALGQGPFSVPLDFNKARVLSRFHVALMEPGEDDPQNTVHFQLLPRIDRRDDVKQIDLWYDRDTLLPRRAATLNVNETEHIIDLLQVNVDAKIDVNLFDTRAPSERGQRGYLEEIRRWDD